MTETTPTVPGPDNFSIDSYVNGGFTFPVEKHVVYRDQASGFQLDALEREQQELNTKKGKLEKRLEIMDKNQVSGLADDGRNDIMEEIDVIDGRIAEIKPRLNALYEKVWNSRITLILQFDSMKKVTKMIRKAERAFDKENGKGSEDDHDYQADKGQYVTVCQLVSYCKGIIFPDSDEPRPPLSHEGFDELMDKLMSSELVRLMAVVNKAVDMSAQWSARIDAGFPGRSPDMGQQSMGHSRPEDGTGLVASTPDAHDGQGHLVV